MGNDCVCALCCIVIQVIFHRKLKSYRLGENKPGGGNRYFRGLPGLNAGDGDLQTILSIEDCFCTVTKMPPGTFIIFLPGNDSVASCGTVVATRSKSRLEDLDGESTMMESADEGTSLGMGRLIIGETGGGERPCGSRVGGG